MAKVLTASKATSSPGKVAHSSSRKPSSLIIEDPFKPSVARHKRCKLFLWGDTGVGKTWLSLQFPGVAMVDMDGGSILYEGMFEFKAHECYAVDTLEKTIAFLASGKHNYQTLVIDPITRLCDLHVEKWNSIFMEYNQSGKGYKFEYYELSLRDWRIIKSDFKRLLTLIMALDMNIIVTAREKPKYEKRGGDMQVVGETFDGEKNLPYEFDCDVHLIYDPRKDLREGVIRKDRGGLLTAAAKGKIFPLNYDVFERAYPNLGLKSQESLATNEQIFKFNSFVEKLNLTEEVVAGRLLELGVSEFRELNLIQAQEVIDNLTEKYHTSASV